LIIANRGLESNRYYYKKRVKGAGDSRGQVKTKIKKWEKDIAEIEKNVTGNEEIF
jgi:uncharacterized protein (DUF2164 family)